MGDGLPRYTVCPRCGPGGLVSRVQVRTFGPVDISWWCASCGHAWPRFPAGTPEHAASVADIAQWVVR